MTENDDSRADDYSYDAAAKAFVSLRSVMAVAGERYISEFEGMSREEIERMLGDEPRLKSQNVKFSNMAGGSVELDNLFLINTPEGLAPVFVNFETERRQWKLVPLLKRAVVYLSAVIFNQMVPGAMGQNYEKVRNVYAFWILKNPPAAYRNRELVYEFKGRVIGGGRDPPACDTIKLILICLGDPMEKRDGISLPLRILDAAMAGNYTKEERLEMLEEQGMNVNELMERDIDSLSKHELEIVEMVRDTKAEARELMIEDIASIVMANMEDLNISAEESVKRLRIKTDYRDEVLDMIKTRTLERTECSFYCHNPRRYDGSSLWGKRA